MIIIISVIPLIFLIINLIFIKKKFIRENKNSPYECGFERLSNRLNSFSLHFYIIALLFLFFDIEISLFFPLIKRFNFIFINSYFYFVFFFILILILRLLIEWYDGALNWKFFINLIKIFNFELKNYIKI